METIREDETKSMPRRFQLRQLPLDQFADGRDELNLADFPISVLQFQQPKDEQGKTITRAVFQATRYDSVTRQRVPQTVTLISEEGLPTPVDENVVLALLYVSKKTSDYQEAKVHFHPHQLFRILGWSRSSDNYDRLRNVLRRLKGLTIRYENAWWDAEGRQYETEFATGLVASYRITRLTRGRKKADEQPQSWMQWHPDFFKSLAIGNIKKLNLEQLFLLKLPISQRMYRFLDKRFYNSPLVDLDLKDFACGHIGLTRTENVAEIKRRLAPAILELESIGFIRPSAERYRKIQKGIWRISLERGDRKDSPAIAPVVELLDPVESSSPEEALVRDFYRSWNGTSPVQITDNELQQARGLFEQFGADQASKALPRVVKLLREKFPDAKRFGATLTYFDEVAKDQAAQQRRQLRLDEQSTRRREERTQAAAEQAALKKHLDKSKARWDSLDTAEQDSIRATVLKQFPFMDTLKLRGSTLVQLECIKELERRQGA